jgi:Flp pilus assembly pilin Flp
MLFLPREKGQGLVEYALILVLVIGNVFSGIVAALNPVG